MIRDITQTNTDVIIKQILSCDDRYYYTKYCFVMVIDIIQKQDMFVYDDKTSACKKNMFYDDRYHHNKTNTCL